MFERLKTRIKNFIDSEDPFSGFSILPFSKYKKKYSSSDYLSAYGISLYANRAVNKRAEKVGAIKFVLKRGDAIVEKHDVLDLLAKPNKAFTGYEFWRLYQKYMDIFGEVYIMLDTELRMGGKTKVNEMHLLQSGSVKPYFNEKTGELQKIEYQTTAGLQVIPGEQIIYSHNPDPANPLRGESLLQSGIRQIETSTQIDEYHSKILENGGRVEGVFNFKTGSLNKNQLKELKEQYQEEYGNASNAGLPLFLAGDATYEKLGLSPNELAYLETKKVTLDDILLLTGVPRAILGLTSNETFSNSDASIRIFLAEVVQPLLQSLVTILDERLVEESLDLSFVDPTPANKEEKRKDLETANTVNAMTTNEKREALGLDPVKGGDTILVPLNLVEMNSQASVEPNKGLIKAFNHPLKNRENREIYHALCLKRLDRRQKRMLDVIENYFVGQRTRLIEKLQGQKRFRVKGLLGEIFGMALEIRLAKDAVLPILQQLLIESAEDAKEIAGSSWDFNETPEIQSWLDRKTRIFAEQITATTFETLQSAFSESLDAGESRQELIGRIEETYGEISKSRAEMIARTEVHGVTQYGTSQGYKQAGLPIKIWVWAPGTRGGMRDAHRAMDGEEKPLESAFSNGLMFPGDYSGGADDVINCQCFI